MTLTRYVAMPDSGYFLDVSPGQMCSLPDRYECECAAGTDPAMGEAGTWTQPGGHSWLGRGQTLAQQVCVTSQAVACLCLSGLPWAPVASIILCGGESVLS
jgi:hypothetical protein